MMRRTIRELVARYRLEPSLREVFVEGSSDAPFLRWVLSDEGRELLITPIEVVDVPRSLLQQYGLSDGNRGRVLALGLEFSETFKSEPFPIRCVADRDFYFLLGVEIPQSDTIIYTDYSSIDVYAYGSASFDKLLQLGLGVEKAGTDLIAATSDALVSLFCIRAALHELGDGSAIINNVSRCFRAEGQRVVVDVDDIIGRSVRSRVSVPAVRTRMEELVLSVLDEREAIHAVDLAEIVFWKHRRAFERRSIRSSLGVRALLATCLEPAVHQEPLFVSLRNFARS